MEYKNVWETTSRTVQTSTNGAHTNTKEYFQTGLETDGNTKLKNQISGDENNKVGRGLNHTGSGPNGRSQNENLEIGVASKPRSQKFNQGVLEGRSDLGQDGNKKTDIYNSEAGQEKRKGDETPVSALGQDECTKICLASNEVGQTVSQEGAKGGSQVSKNECQNEAGQTSAPNENAVQKNEGHHGGPEGGLDPQGKVVSDAVAANEVQTSGDDEQNNCEGAEGEAAKQRRTQRWPRVTDVTKKATTAGQKGKG